MRVAKKIEEFELKHRIIFFTLTVFLTILIIRIITYVKDLNIFLFSYELHHFYFGIIILIITNLFILFGHRNYKISLILTGIGIGLILDEFIFILGKLDNSSYFSTTPFALISLLIIIGLVIVIDKFSKKS